MTKRRLKNLSVCIMLALIAAFSAALAAVPAYAGEEEPAAGAYTYAPGAALEYLNRFFDGDANRERRTGTEGARKTAEWIAAEFKALSDMSKLTAESAPYFTSTVAKTKADDPDYIKEIELVSSAGLFQKETKVAVYNVAGYFKSPASGAATKTVIIGANYDNLYGLEYNQGYYSKSEGALDNASGVAAMLAAAKTVVENATKAVDPVYPEFNIMFVAFGGGNNGFYGSYDMTVNFQRYHSVITLSDIALMVNLSCIAGGDKLYLYCDEVETPHQNRIKEIADSLPGNVGLNLPPKNKKIVPAVGSPILYTHKGLSGDNFYFWSSRINAVNIFGYNWDINASGDTESQKGGIAGTDADTFANLFTYYENGKEMLDSAAHIAAGIIYDSEMPAVLTAGKAEKFDYRAFVTNPVYSFVYQMAVVIGVIVLLALMYSGSKKYTPKVIIQKYTAKISVFGDEYESGGSGQNSAEGNDKPGNPFE